jgi:hypothetical protein
VLGLQAAREIMDRTESADEYALCLRNLAWNDFEGDLRPELSDRFERLLKTEVWLKSPTSGWLEAMDVAVAISDPRQFGNLVGLVAGRTAEEAPELVRAVGIALDRMVLRNPSLLVDASVSTDLPPILRASLLSRLDITREDARGVFVNYLAAGDHGEGELEYFAQLFPNGNYVVGHRLITKDEPSLSIAARMEADRKVLAELQKLGQDSSGTIARIRERLEMLTGSGG